MGEEVRSTVLGEGQEVKVQGFDGGGTRQVEIAIGLEDVRRRGRRSSGG